MTLREHCVNRGMYWTTRKLSAPRRAHRLAMRVMVMEALGLESDAG